MDLRKKWARKIIIANIFYGQMITWKRPGSKLTKRYTKNYQKKKKTLTCTNKTEKGNIKTEPKKTDESSEFFKTIEQRWCQKLKKKKFEKYLHQKQDGSFLSRLPL